VKQDLEESRQHFLALQQEIHDMRDQLTPQTRVEQSLEEMHQHLQSLDYDFSAVRN